MKNQLRALRRERQLTQQDLAEALSVGRQSIISIESGKYDPSLPLAFKISHFFGVPIAEIFTPD